jgi:hypothetical protein
MISPIIDYDEIPPEERPQDDSQTGKGWKFEILEHDEVTFPRAIRAIDAQGRSYIYLAVGPDWRAVRIKLVDFDPSPQTGSNSLRYPRQKE